MLAQAVSSIVLMAIAAGVAQAGQREELLRPGSYEVRVRLELPHVENRAIEKTTIICLADADGGSAAALPVLSGNNPLADCPARNFRRDGATLRFDIVCDGRHAARGRAVYTLMPRAFAGRIAMRMGGKNMTMTEVQVGQWVSSCDPAGAPQQ